MGSRSRTRRKRPALTLETKTEEVRPLITHLENCFKRGCAASPTRLALRRSFYFTLLRAGIMHLEEKGYQLNVSLGGITWTNADQRHPPDSPDTPGPDPAPGTLELPPGNVPDSPPQNP